VILPLVEKLTAKLDALDTAAWSEEDHRAAVDSFTALRDTLDARLNPPASNLA